MYETPDMSYMGNTRHLHSVLNIRMKYETPDMRCQWVFFLHPSNRVFINLFIYYFSLPEIKVGLKHESSSINFGVLYIYI